MAHIELRYCMVLQGGVTLNWVLQCMERYGKSENYILDLEEFYFCMLEIISIGTV